MDKVSRDVLEEAKSVLCELIGYLAAVEENQGAYTDSAVRDLSVRLVQVVSDLEYSDDGSRVLQLPERNSP